MMSSINNIIRNQEEIHAVMEHLPPPALVVLSFRNILEKFPEFLIHVLSYIEDRTVWNSIASCNKHTYRKI